MYSDHILPESVEHRIPTAGEERDQRCEQGDATRRLAIVEPTPWFCVPNPGGRPRMSLARLRILLSVSRDEEHVGVMICDGLPVVLGARSCHYLLLTLARKRLKDIAAGLPEPDRGWLSLDAVAHDPSMAPSRISLDVHRLRRQLEAQGVEDAASIVERRPRSRELRVGTDRITVRTE